ncbi:MAG: cysteine hydrolase family protein [Acidimicrobiales bacterium]
MRSELEPKTLRTIAGLTDHPPRLADATLIVIDAQVAYTAEGQLALTGVADAAKRIAGLLAQARSAGGPIIHVAHLGPEGSAFDPVGGGRFMGEAAPNDGEHVVSKSLPNAFAGTTLLELLKGFESRPLILCGFMTHMCVSSTARAALDLGFETTIVSDATATRDLPGTIGQEIVSAAAVHHASLAALADRFSIVATTDEILESRPAG